MDTMLLVVTVVSLMVAAVSCTVAWQVTRAERQRRAARVAALVEAAGLTAVPFTAPPSEPSRRSNVIPLPSAMPSALHEFMPVDDVQTSEPALAPDIAPTFVPTSGGLFAQPSAASGSTGRQQWLMGAAGVFAAVVIAVAGIGFLSSHATGTVVGPARIPLELVAMSHNRSERGLAVAGLVRNPATGAGVPQLDAEVRVFDAAGILIGTQSAHVDASPLAAGQEATFAVTLGALTTAARYRVSFTTAGTMVPHVDRRTNQPAAVTAEAR